MSYPKYNKSFLKWVGGKYRSLDRIYGTLPVGKRLVEPFAGSGVVFLNAGIEYNLICDVNPDLILVFQLLSALGDEFIQETKSYFTADNNTLQGYLRLRERFNTLKGDERGPLFVYLNRHSYNGLIRYSQKGMFNSPFGRYERPYFPEAEMNFFYQKCQQSNVRFLAQDYVTTFSMVEPDDTVFCDPPYMAADGQEKTFASYKGKRFTEEDHIHLRCLARQAGVPVLICNHSTDRTERLYADADFIRADDVRRTISCKVNERRLSSELLVLYSPNSKK